MFYFSMSIVFAIHLVWPEERPRRKNSHVRRTILDRLPGARRGGAREAPLHRRPPCLRRQLQDVAPGKARGAHQARSSCTG